MEKAERQRTDAFELWCCWRRLLRVPWTTRRSNQSILKEISPACSLEGLLLKLKLQSFGHLMWRVDSLEKTLMLGGIGAGREGDDRGWDGWMASLTRWTWVSVNSGGWWWTGRPGVLWFMGSQSRTQLSDWTELNWMEIKSLINVTSYYKEQEKGSVNWKTVQWKLSRWASLVAQIDKHLPTMQETQVWSLGQEDLLAKEMATHSSTLAWKIPWMEEPGRLYSMQLQRVGHNWVTHLLTFVYTNCV